MRRGKGVTKKQVLRELQQTDVYLRANDIAKKLSLSKGSVYRAIRILREEMVGIHSAKDGYVISEAATVQDDVHQMRRWNGRRTSDAIAAHAAAPHIRERWSGITDKGQYRTIMEPLLPSLKLLSDGRDSLLKRT